MDSDGRHVGSSYVKIEFPFSPPIMRNWFQASYVTGRMWDKFKSGSKSELRRFKNQKLLASLFMRNMWFTFLDSYTSQMTEQLD